MPPSPIILGRQNSIWAEPAPGDSTDWEEFFEAQGKAVAALFRWLDAAYSLMFTQFGEEGHAAEELQQNGHQLVQQAQVAAEGQGQAVVVGLPPPAPVASGAGTISADGGRPGLAGAALAGAASASARAAASAGGGM